MTLATLNERLRAYDHLCRWILVAAVSLSMLAVTAGGQLGHVLVEPWWGQPEGPEERRARVLAGTVVSSLIIVGVALLVAVLGIGGGIWAVRKLGLLCPSCGASLTGRNKYPARGTGKCGRCQARVVEDAPASLLGAPLPTRDEFLARLGEYQAAYQRQGEWDVHALMLCLFLPGPPAAWLFSAYVEPALRPVGLFWLALLLFWVVAFSPLFVFWHYLRRCESRLQQSHGLTCRWCGAGLTGANGKTAAATGRCAACGQLACTDAA